MSTTAEAPTIPEALDALRALLAQGYTKAAIAQHLGVDWRSVHRWAEGMTSPRSVGQRRQLVQFAAEGQAA